MQRTFLVDAFGNPKAKVEWIIPIQLPQVAVKGYKYGYAKGQAIAAAAVMVIGQQTS